MALTASSLVRGISYAVRDKLYVSLTSASVMSGESLISLRGPGFTMPDSFAEVPEGKEPSAQQVFEAVELAYSAGYDSSATVEDEMLGVCIAGSGEPLLRIDTLCEACTLIKEKRHGVPIRVMTSGLIGADRLDDLSSCGVDELSVLLMGQTPNEYSRHIQPSPEVSSSGFQSVVAFVVGAAERGFKVECTTIAKPGVDVSATRALAMSLGAQTFRERSYHG